MMLELTALYSYITKLTIKRQVKIQTTNDAHINTSLNKTIYN